MFVLGEIKLFSNVVMSVLGEIWLVSNVMSVLCEIRLVSNVCIG